MSWIWFCPCHLIYASGVLLLLSVCAADMQVHLRLKICLASSLHASLHAPQATSQILSSPCYNIHIFIGWTPSVLWCLRLSQYDCTFHFKGSSKCDRGIHLNTSYVMSHLYSAFWLVICRRLCLSADYLTLVQILHDIHPVYAWLTSQESVFEPHLLSTYCNWLVPSWKPQIIPWILFLLFFSHLKYHADVFQVLVFDTSLDLIYFIML